VRVDERRLVFRLKDCIDVAGRQRGAMTDIRSDLRAGCAVLPWACQSLLCNIALR
jgi:hypothetical protein